MNSCLPHLQFPEVLSINIGLGTHPAKGKQLRFLAEKGNLRQCYFCVLFSRPVFVGTTLTYRLNKFYTTSTAYSHTQSSSTSCTLLYVISREYAQVNTSSPLYCAESADVAALHQKFVPLPNQSLRQPLIRPCLMQGQSENRCLQAFSRCVCTHNI